MVHLGQNLCGLDNVDISVSSACCELTKHGARCCHSRRLQYCHELGCVLRSSELMNPESLASSALRLASRRGGACLPGPGHAKTVTQWVVLRRDRKRLSGALRQYSEVPL